MTHTHTHKCRIGLEAERYICRCQSLASWRRENIYGASAVRWRKLALNCQRAMDERKFVDFTLHNCFIPTMIKTRRMDDDDDEWTDGDGDGDDEMIGAP
jgi:hypothetical protein